MLWIASPVKFGGNLPFQITPGEHLIGRGSACQIVIRDVSISRTHARLSFRDGRLAIEDLRRRNGTIVQGKRVQSSGVHLDSALRLGNVRLYFVQVENASDVDACLAESETVQNEFELDLRIDSLGSHLTRTQLGIVRLLVEGKSEAEIARLLFRSRATVHNHVQAIYRRLNVHSVADLMRRAIGNETTVLLPARHKR
jgi:DNA-binding NarL/FixJ family response regulator